MDPFLKRSYQYCETLARAEARNFYYSFVLLPPDRRRAMCALYAFLRKTDDLADEPGEKEAKRQSLEEWRQALGAALQSQLAEDWPGWPALAHTAKRYCLCQRNLEDVIEGVLMDLEPCVYPSYDALHRYCYHVASAVGLNCIRIWGFNSDGGRAERLAETCGVALQLTNIIRDVREDALRERVYLPKEDLDRFGVEIGDLALDYPTERLRNLLKFEGERAYQLYEQARPLVGLVDPVGRPVLRALVGIYRALLDEMAHRDYDVLRERARLSPWRKSCIVARGLLG